MLKLTVDGIEVEVPAGATVLQACEATGKAQMKIAGE
jgi:NADH-quinone oxidoreductase subunit G